MDYPSNEQSKVEGFQIRVDKMNKQLDDYLDLSSVMFLVPSNKQSLDYFDKWARNMKTKMYEVSHVMEEICSIEQDELRNAVFSVSSLNTDMLQ